MQILPEQGGRHEGGHPACGAPHLADRSSTRFKKPDLNIIQKITLQPQIDRGGVTVATLLPLGKPERVHHVVLSPQSA